MSSKQATGRRTGADTALSDFADYVERQQALRGKAAAGPSTVDVEDELSIIDQLNLGEDEPGANQKLRDLLLPSAEEDARARESLKGVLKRLIAEGRGEALFDVGLERNGDNMGLGKEEYEKALGRLREVSKEIKCVVTVLLEEGAEATEGCNSKALVRKQPESIEELLEIRVAVVGNVDAGKSTLLGVLTKGTLDDGRGKSRVNLFRHKHEIESGRTSSVGMEILGFDTESKIVGATVPGRKLTWEEIGNRSSKVISFSDLAGHEKYLRTTVFGLLGTSPDYVMLMVAANNGLIGMSREHLGIALALNVPVLVVITKIDICPPKILQQTIQQLTKIMKSAGARKIPIFIKSKEEVIHTATHFVSDRICPIFQVSNVTGEGLEFVKAFLNIIPYHGKFDSKGPFEFHVNDCFSVPFVGTVVSGVVKSGIIHAGDQILIGPDSLGYFTTTAIRSIERKRLPVPVCTAGQSASFALKRVRRKDVRKGMVVLPKMDPPPVAHREFVAEVLILSHATTIKPNYQAMLHVGPVSQTCTIIDIDREYMRAGDRANVAFRFYQRPEYVCVGDKLIFREGRTKGLGVIKQVGYDKLKAPLSNKAKKEAEEVAADAAAARKAADVTVATKKAAGADAPAAATRKGAV